MWPFRKRKSRATPSISDAQLLALIDADMAAAAARRNAPMVVTRVQTGNGSHIEPPCDDAWPDRMKLEWWAAVTADDTGLRVEVRDAEFWHGGVKKYGYYSVIVGHGSITPLTFDQALSYLSGVSTGAAEAEAGPQ